MLTSHLIITIFSLIMLIPTLASLTRFDQWWVRGFDFPRIQISFILIILLFVDGYMFNFSEIWQILLLALLGCSLLYQLKKIYPFTILAKKQVLNFNGTDPDDSISILISNVLTPNKHSDKLIDRVYKENPDILLTLESDKRWENELKVIEKDYPFRVKVPKDNLYGMHLYSKLQLDDVKVEYIISEEIPSIHCHVLMKNNMQIKLHCLHPKPPSPSEDFFSTNRDAELLLVGADVKRDQESVLVIGDLNDVAWSRTTQLFRKSSGLLDPRIGRGFFNTFHTKFRLFRWPLDHAFHTNDFTLIGMKRLKSIGSDHFPMFIKLNFDPRAEILQKESEAPDEDEQEWIEEKIENGNPTVRDV